MMMRYMESMGAIFRKGGVSIDLTHHAFHVLGSRILGFMPELYDDSEQLSDTPEMMAIMARQMAAEFPVMTELATAIRTTRSWSARAATTSSSSSSDST